MTKMAAMPIYGKNPSKIFFSETNRLISRKLGVKHRWLKYSNVYINHDPVMTLTKFVARTTWVPYAFELGTFEGKNQQEIGKWTEYWRSWKRKWPKGFICLCAGVKYHNIQTCLLVYAADLRWAFTGPLVLWLNSLLQQNVRFYINLLVLYMIFQNLLGFQNFTKVLFRSTCCNI